MINKSSEWAVIDTKIANKAGPTDVSLHLQSVVDDYEQFMVKKLRMISENTDYDQETQMLQQLKYPPMLPEQFKEQLEQTKNNILSRMQSIAVEKSDQFYNS